jgi:hypothetical protein
VVNFSGYFDTVPQSWLRESDETGCAFSLLTLQPDDGRLEPLVRDQEAVEP